jgi:hypothetical protein
MQYDVQYTALYVMLLMGANPLRGQVGRGWSLEIETFWALWNGIEPLQVPFGSKKVMISRAQLPPTCLSNEFA